MLCPRLSWEQVVLSSCRLVASREQLDVFSTGSSRDLAQCGAFLHTVLSRSAAGSSRNSGHSSQVPGGRGLYE